MKKAFYTYICFLLLPILTFSQNYDLSGMQGLKNESGDLMFEIAGYEIFISETKGQINNTKTINSIKKKSQLTNILSEYGDYIFETNVKIIATVEKIKGKPNVQNNKTSYLFNKSEKEVTNILFQTCNQRDIFLEQEVVKTYLENKLSDYIDNWAADSVSFAGRTLNLGSACKWMSPHNIHCRGGQISWSEFPSFQSANLDANTRIAANSGDNNVLILQEEDIDVIFEDIPSVAHRVVYYQKSRYGRTNPLIAYYIVQEVRGRYISCVMSNYGYNRNDYELAPLLQQVMSIPVVPETAHRQFDIPERENITDEDNEQSYSLNMWEVKAGAWMPMGNLQNTFNVAPSVGAFLGVPIRTDMAIDFGVQLAFPINSGHFDYYYKKEFYDRAKARDIINISLRWHYQKEMARNVYWTSYLGAGLNALGTNLKKDDYEDNTKDTWHSVETIGLFGGVSIRYKKLGCFLEYQYAPYSIASKVRSNFGHSAIHTGVSVFF